MDKNLDYTCTHIKRAEVELSQFDKSDYSFTRSLLSRSGAMASGSENPSYNGTNECDINYLLQ